MKQRFGVVTADNALCILEIWSSSATHQPRFDKTWHNFQFILAKNVTYHGTTKLEEFPDQAIYVFRMGQKDAEISRFIWLSSETAENFIFWDNPVEEVADTFRDRQDEVNISY